MVRSTWIAENPKQDRGGKSESRLEGKKKEKKMMFYISFDLMPIKFMFAKLRNNLFIHLVKHQKLIKELSPWIKTIFCFF